MHSNLNISGTSDIRNAPALEGFVVERTVAVERSPSMIAISADLACTNDCDSRFQAIVSWFPDSLTWRCTGAGSGPGAGLVNANAIAAATMRDAAVTHAAMRRGAGRARSGITSMGRGRNAGLGAGRGNSSARLSTGVGRFGETTPSLLSSICGAPGNGAWMVSRQYGTSPRREKSASRTNMPTCAGSNLKGLITRAT